MAGVTSFGPWRSRSRNQTHSAGSSNRLFDGIRDSRLHEQPNQHQDSEGDKMATRGTPPEFVLAPNELKKESAGRNHDPKVQRERMNMFKRQLASNRKRHEEAQRRNMKAGPQPVHTVSSSTARSVVEALREQRLMDGPEEGLEEHDEIDAAQISAQDWPFIYFVVALDQMPVAKEDMDEYRVGKPHTARERQRFLAARKRRIQQSREEMERIREANIDMGLRLEPIRPPSRPTGVQINHAIMQDARRRAGAIARHPPTPISSGSSRDFPYRADYILNHADELSMDDLMCRGFSQWFSDNFSMHSSQQGTTVTNGASVKGGDGGGGGGGRRKREGQDSDNSTVELPDIQPESRRRTGAGLSSSAPGSLSNMSNNKKVHFAEGLPYIKGSGIPTAHVANKLTADTDQDKPRPETTNENAAREFEDTSELFQPPWSAPVTSRSLATMAPRSKMFKPMPIPKIDIVSEIYDELIVKTIQSFLQREGYSPERFHQLRCNIMARLSATYPHLARHRAWRLVRKDGPDGQQEVEGEERARGRVRPYHQGFFNSPQTPTMGLGPDVREAFMQVTNRRSPQEPLRPRWVPVVPSYRPMTSQEERLGSMFMAVDGRHIVFTPRDEMRFKTCLPGATSDYRMAPLVIQEDKPVKTWTHIIPSGHDESL